MELKWNADAYVATKIYSRESEFYKFMIGLIEEAVTGIKSENNVLDLGGGTGEWGQLICDLTGAKQSICYDTSEDMLAKAALYKSVVTKHLPIQSALINESQIFSFILMKEVNTFVDEEFYFRLADFARAICQKKL